MTSFHYKNHRHNRENFIEQHLCDDGIMVDGFIVNRKHKNGLEMHSITDKGIIIIHNFDSGKLITKLIARENQIKRYYELSGRKPPPEYDNILNLARLHEKLGYNSI